MPLCELSEAGTRRSHNEDCTWAQDDGDMLWAAAADGIGGCAAGEVASKLAVEAARASLHGVDREDLRNPVTCAAAVRDAVVAAHERVCMGSRSQPAWAEMGAALLVCVVTSDYCCAAWMGNCRLYVVREGRAILLTKDHSWVRQEQDRGMLEKSAALHDPRRHMLVHYCGSKKQAHADVCCVPVYPRDDLFLVLSDGVFNVLDDTDIGTAIQESLGDPAEVGRQLAEMSALYGSGDDRSLVVLVPPGAAAPGHEAAPRRCTDAVEPTVPDISKPRRRRQRSQRRVLTKLFWFSLLAALLATSLVLLVMKCEQAVSRQTAPASSTSTKADIHRSGTHRSLPEPANTAAHSHEGGTDAE